jgi:hypothetical protein
MAQKICHSIIQSRPNNDVDNVGAVNHEKATIDSLQELHEIYIRSYQLHQKVSLRLYWCLHTVSWTNHVTTCMWRACSHSLARQPRKNFLVTRARLARTHRKHVFRFSAVSLGYLPSDRQQPFRSNPRLGPLLATWCDAFVVSVIPPVDKDDSEFTFFHRNFPWKYVWTFQGNAAANRPFRESQMM